MPASLPWRAGLSKREQVLPVPKISTQTPVTLAPLLEPFGEGAKQPSLGRRVLPHRGTREKAGTELRVPSDVVLPTHLVLKETCEQQALRPGGLHHGTVTLEGGVQDEVVKHGPEGFGGGHLAVSLRRHLGVVRQHAGVVEQLLAVNRPFGYVS